MEVNAGAGSLFVVATPIGNLNDISPRALEVLRQVKRIAAEDTRHSARLLQHYTIKTPMLALHDFNEAEQVDSVLASILQGEDIALISDAGTPLISDPGYRLVRQAHVAGIRVVPVPGPSSLTAALSAAGLPTDRFCFEGFLPPKTTSRKKLLAQLGSETRTLVMFEAPHRILECFVDLSSVFGEEREAVLCKELSKSFETVITGSLGEIMRWLELDSDHRRGEFVILIRGAQPQQGELDEQAERILSILVSELPVSQAAALAARITGRKKNALYQAALGMQNVRDKGNGSV